MDRQMEPTSQIFSQGGILSRDWFSDKLNKERGKEALVTSDRLFRNNASISSG